MNVRFILSYCKKLKNFCHFVYTTIKRLKKNINISWFYSPFYIENSKETNFIHHLCVEAETKQQSVCPHYPSQSATNERWIIPPEYWDLSKQVVSKY